MAKKPLRNLLFLIQNRFLQTNPIPSSSSSKTPSSKSALLPSKPLPIPGNTSPESESVISCLKSYGFESTQITKLVQKRPEVLHCRVDAKLKPKLKYLIQKGFTGKLLPQLIVSNPLILFRSLDSHIKPSFELLSPFLAGEDLLVALKRSGSWLLTFNPNSILQPNVDLLISEGVTAERISKLLVVQPRVILQSHDRMIYAVKTVKEIGLNPKEPRFIHALRVICSMSKLNWEKKVEAFMSLGWTKEEVLTTFRKDPLCLACSEIKVRHMMNFFVNTMKLDPKTIIAYPKLLLYSVERITARYKVMKVLESMNLIKEDKKIVWLMTKSEKNFLEEYVAKNTDKVPDLLDIYHGAVKPRKTTKAKIEKFDSKSLFKLRKTTKANNEKSDPRSASLIPKFSS
ncbi:hypothetical protein PTKIN_Ptkin16aG0061000 [Pterospermum kingtungense]